MVELSIHVSRRNVEDGGLVIKMVYLFITSAACGAAASRVAGVGFIVIASLLALVGALYDGLRAEFHLAAQIALAYAAFLLGYLSCGTCCELRSGNILASQKLKSRSQK